MKLRKIKKYYLYSEDEFQSDEFDTKDSKFVRYLTKEKVSMNSQHIILDSKRYYHS